MISIKTIKNIYPYICQFQNAELAYQKARKSRRTRADFLHYELNRNINLSKIVESLETKTYQMQDFRYHTIYDPKERLIMALPTDDRIVQHMWNTYIEPILDSRFIYHSYSSRPMKGVHAASAELHNWIHAECTIKKLPTWTICGDLSKYFASIDHEILKYEMRRYIGDKNALWLTDKFIDHNGIMPDGIGIPIGNVSSQLFSNVYGNILDKHVKYDLGVEFYMRYADDFIILGHDFHELEYILNDISQFVASVMKIQLNPNSKIVCAYDGVPFIGFKHFPDYTIPKRETLTKINQLLIGYKNNKFNDDYFQMSYNSRVGFVKHSDTFTIQRHFEDELSIILLEKENILI